MGNEIAVQKDSVIQAVDMGTLTEYMDATGLTKQLLPSEKTMFINMAQLYGLNPFKREIYCNVYGQGQYRQCSIITGYEVYLKRAERIGKLDGWHTEEVGNLKDGTFGVKVIIYRKDWSHAFEHTAYYNEVKQTKKDGTPNRFWAQQPRFMTKKVAVAQAFRMCFPDEFGGMPYLNDELGIETSAPVIENITPPQEPVEDRGDKAQWPMERAPVGCGDVERVSPSLRMAGEQPHLHFLLGSHKTSYDMSQITSAANTNRHSHIPVL